MMDILSASCTSVSSGIAMKFTVEIRAAGALQTGERIFFVSSQPSTDIFSISAAGLKMQLRPRYHGQQNVILCHLACAPSGMFLQVNQMDTEVYLRLKYPGVTSIIYLPRSFSSVVNYLRVDFANGTFGKTHYHVLLNREITAYFSSLKGVSMDALSNTFPTEGSVQELCLKFIIDDYVTVTSKGFTTRKSLRIYQSKVLSAKEHLMHRRLARLNHEMYLGTNDFEAELNRSCGEFYYEFRKVLGFSPVRWYSIN